MTTTPKRVVFTMGGKGGVGKTGVIVAALGGMVRCERHPSNASGS